MRLALILSLAILCACSQPRSDVLHRGPAITVRYDHAEGINGTWEASTGTIRLSSLCPQATLAHELCHAADTYGSFARAVQALGPCDLPGADIVHQIALACAGDARPNAHWIALGRICGLHAVQHPHLVAFVRPLL